MSSDSLPDQLAASLGDISQGDESLARILAGPPDAVLAAAIRDSFADGDEQGNHRRMQALVHLEGEGALDVLEAVLVDEIEVGGIYSNLRNSALPIMAERFPGPHRCPGRRCPSGGDLRRAA